MPTTATYLLPYPATTAPPAVPADMQALANRIEVAIAPGTATGQIPVWDNTAKVWAPSAAAAAPGMVLIQDIVLASAGGIAFTSIPGSYKHLMIEWQGRCSTASGLGYAGLAFNSVLSGYYFERLQVTGTTVTGAEGIAVSPGDFGFVAGTTVTAGLPCSGTIHIPNYTATTFGKSWTAISVGGGSASSGGVYSGTWSGFTSAATAISRIDLYAQGGTNWLAGSRATLYGIA